MSQLARVGLSWRPESSFFLQFSGACSERTDAPYESHKLVVNRIGLCHEHTMGYSSYRLYVWSPLSCGERIGNARTVGSDHGNHWPVVEE